ncbi:hypothetical protein ACTXT7_008229 [Hymenolepis weldensis]
MGTAPINEKLGHEVRLTTEWVVFTVASGRNHEDTPLNSVKFNKLHNSSFDSIDSVNGVYNEYQSCTND